MGRPKKERAASDADEGPYLVFRYCKDQCFRAECKQCGYFWGPGQSTDRVGRPAVFGIEERKRQNEGDER